MKKQLTTSQYVEKSLDSILKQAQEEDVTVTGLANNIKFLKEQMAVINDEFPREVSTNFEQKVLNETISDCQEAMASEFVRIEPELVYKNELSPEEAFTEFQNYMVEKMSNKVTHEVIDKVYRPLLNKRYRQVLRKTPYEGFETLYRNAKSG